MLGTGPVSAAPIAAIEDGGQVTAAALDADLQVLASTLAGATTAPVTGTLAASLQAATANLSGTVVTGTTGTLAASLQAVTANVVGATTGPVTGTLAGSLQAIGSTLTGTFTFQTTGALSASLQALTADLEGSSEFEAIGTLAATFEALTANLVATAAEEHVDGSLAATLQALTANLAAASVEAAELIVGGVPIPEVASWPYRLTDVDAQRATPTIVRSATAGGAARLPSIPVTTGLLTTSERDALRTVILTPGLHPIAGDLVPAPFDAELLMVSEQATGKDPHWIVEFEIHARGPGTAS